MNKFGVERPSGRTILLVDDDLEYLAAMGLLLEREGHLVLRATNGPQALQMLHQSQVDLLLLDYYMPGMTGEDVVARLRQFNPYVQVILQTGYPSEKPRRDMLRRLDIQGYYDKTEGVEKFLMWVDIGLKAASTVQFLNTNRQGLRYVLDATPALHKIQPLKDLLREILRQLEGLMCTADSVLTPQSAEAEPGRLEIAPVEGFLAMLDDDSELFVRAGLGRFDRPMLVTDCLAKHLVDKLHETLQQGEIQRADHVAVIPLRVGGLAVGVVYLEWPGRQAPDGELLQIFANQAAVAIQNIQLYEMATLDPLTGVYVRRFFVQWLFRELRTAFRTRQPLSLLMVDMDSLKHINDTAGHLTGDQALTELAGVLRCAVRTSDIVGRYGGDEFTIILPQTPADGADRVGQRILELLQGKSVPAGHAPIPLSVSIGLSALEAPNFSGANVPYRVTQSYFQVMAQTLLLRADQALYQAKREGGSRLSQSTAAVWPPPNVPGT